MHLQVLWPLDGFSIGVLDTCTIHLLFVWSRKFAAFTDLGDRARLWCSAWRCRMPISFQCNTYSKRWDLLRTRENWRLHEDWMICRKWKTAVEPMALAPWSCCGQANSWGSANQKRQDCLLKIFRVTSVNIFFKMTIILSRRHCRPIKVLFRTLCIYFR